MTACKLWVSARVKSGLEPETGVSAVVAASLPDVIDYITHTSSCLSDKRAATDRYRGLPSIYLSLAYTSTTVLMVKITNFFFCRPYKDLDFVLNNLFQMLRLVFVTGILLTTTGIYRFNIQFPQLCTTRLYPMRQQSCVNYIVLLIVMYCSERIYIQEESEDGSEIVR